MFAAMKRLVPIAAMVLFAAPSALAAPVVPKRYMPSNAGAVIVWKDPATTLSRVESLASRAGAVPPSATSGWLRASLVRESPLLAEVDLSRPIWIAAMPEPDEGGEAAVESDPRLVVVFGVVGKGEKLAAAFEERMRVTIRDAWMIGVDRRLSASLSKPRKRPFEFPEHSKALRDRSDVAGYVRLDAYPSIRKSMSEPDAAVLAELPPVIRPLMSASQAAQAQQWDDIEGIGFGAGIEDSGVQALLQTHPKPKSELAREGLRRKNASGPIIRGLPPEDFVLVGAALPGDAKNDRWVTETWRAAMRAMTDVDPKLEAELEKLPQIVEDFAPCERHAFGVAMPTTVESVQLFAASQCRSAKKFERSLRVLMDWTQSVLTAGAQDPDGSEAPTTQRTEGSRKVGDHRLDEWRLRLPEGQAPASTELTAALGRPVVFGAVGARATVVGWNVPDTALSRLVASSKAAEPLRRPSSLTSSRAALLSPRHTEMFLFLGPIVSATGTLPAGAMAPLRILMSQMPPVGFSAQTREDGSQLFQLHFPRQLAQLLAALAQMQQ